MFTNKKNQKGQVLVIILIVMLVLGITVITITNNTVRDISQSKQNTQYETLYSIGEKHVLNLTQSLPVETNNLLQSVQTTLTETGFSENECVNAPDHSPSRPSVICDVQDPSNPVDDSVVRIKIIDSPYIENVVLNKDETIIFKVENQVSLSTQNIGIILEGDGLNFTALDVAVDFSFQAPGFPQAEYSSVRGIIDRGPIIAGEQNFFLNIQTISANQFFFPYDDIKTKIVSQYTNKFTALTTDQINIIQFRFRPIIHNPSITDESQPSVTLSVRNYNPTSGGTPSIPDPGSAQSITQSRKVESSAFVIKDDGLGNDRIFGAQALVEGTQALYRHPSIFDYVLRSRTDISHNNS